MWRFVVRFIDRFFKLKSFREREKKHTHTRGCFSFPLSHYPDGGKRRPWHTGLPHCNYSWHCRCDLYWQRHNKTAHHAVLFCLSLPLASRCVCVCVCERSIICDFYYVVDDAIISWLTLHKKCFQAIKTAHCLLHSDAIVECARHIERSKVVEDKGRRKRAKSQCKQFALRPPSSSSPIKPDTISTMGYIMGAEKKPTLNDNKLTYDRMCILSCHSCGVEHIQTGCEAVSFYYTHTHTQCTIRMMKNVIKTAIKVLS